jgi:hypothetical protein
MVVVRLMGSFPFFFFCKAEKDTLEATRDPSDGEKTEKQQKKRSQKSSS